MRAEKIYYTARSLFPRFLAPKSPLTDPRRSVRNGQSSRCREDDSLYFENAEYLEEAMATAGTSSPNDVPGKQIGNKRLALVGDALIIFDDWYADGTSTGK